MTDKSQERIDLEARAEALGVEFRSNIGDDTLAERVKAAEETLDAAANAGAQASAEVATEALEGITDDDVFVVTGPRKGRWRAKRFFTAEPTRIPVSELTDDEIALIDSDDKLTVEVEHA